MSNCHVGLYIKTEQTLGLVDPAIPFLSSQHRWEWEISNSQADSTGFCLLFSAADFAGAVAALDFWASHFSFP